MNKPTMQDIADILGVSRISVWKAISGREDVSSSLRQKVLDTAEKLGYKSNSFLMREKTFGKYNTIAIAISRLQVSPFWSQIIHELAKQLGKNDVNLLYAHLPLQYKDGDNLPAVLTNGEVGGVIILNVYCEETLRKLAKLDVPKLFFDKTPKIKSSELNADVLLLEGKNSSFEITANLIKNGAKKLGFIGDVDYSQINNDIYTGFLNAHKEYGIEVDRQCSITTSFFPDIHYEKIFAFLDSIKEMPDAFVCASNYMASFVIRYFNEHKELKKPEITGFYNDYYNDGSFKRITTVEVDTQALGKRLANKILFLRDYPNLPTEVATITTYPMFEKD